jgi:hypothetical protein
MRAKKATKLKPGLVWVWLNLHYPCQHISVRPCVYFVGRGYAPLVLSLLRLLLLVNAAVDSRRNGSTAAHLSINIVGCASLPLFLYGVSCLRFRSDAHTCVSVPRGCLPAITSKKKAPTSNCSERLSQVHPIDKARGTTDKFTAAVVRSGSMTLIPAIGDVLRVVEDASFTGGCCAIIRQVA